MRCSARAGSRRPSASSGARSRSSRAAPICGSASADVLARSGRVDDAIAQYRLAIAAEPRAARAHANLALALAGVGQLQAARFHFERALELTPPGPQGAPGRARLLAALDALAAERTAAGRADEAARLRALAAELERSAPQPE